MTPAGGRPVALITNDDGIDALGLRVLARGAARAGLEPLVVAPSWDSSGASASFTAVEDDDGHVMVAKRELADLEEVVAFAVDAAPAFIVRAALAGSFGAVPDLVLSGVNRGANTGRAVLHSGTVGAALTARALGVSAMAISLDVPGDGDDDPEHEAWASTDSVLARILPELRPDDVRVVNVNIPAVGPDSLRGIRRATLAPAGAVQVSNSTLHGKQLRIEYQPWRADHPEGSDAALLAQRWATVTALRVQCEDPDAELDPYLDAR